MNNSRSLTIQVQRELVRLSTESSPVGRKAATELMELPREEIRLVLGETLRNPIALCPIVENSMSLNGDGGPSLLSALEPAEIQQMVRFSRQVFADEFIFMDVENGVYDSVSEEFVRKVFANPEANKNLIARLKYYGNPLEMGEKSMRGPWAILRDEVAIRPEAVLDYLLSIKDTDQSTNWKVAAVKALGMELVVYADRFHQESLLEICQEINEELYQEMVKLANSADSNLLKVNLIESHLEQIEEATSIPSVTEEDLRGFEQTDIDLDKAVNDLLAAKTSEFKSETFGTLDVDDIKKARQANGILQRLLKKGGPNPEKK